MQTCAEALSKKLQRAKAMSSMESCGLHLWQKPCNPTVVGKGWAGGVRRVERLGGEIGLPGAAVATKGHR